MNPVFCSMALFIAAALFAAEEKPKPPLDLAPPPEPPSTWHDNDLTKADAENLRAVARRLADHEELPEEAAQLQHWAIKADPERGHRNLACFYSIAGKLDASFHWLQYCVMDGDRVTIRAGRIVVIGFSQGAQLAVELPARDPDTFAGGIALCPGGRRGCQLGAITKPSDLLLGRSFLVIHGELEHESHRDMGASDERWHAARNALAPRHVYPGMSHSFPPDEIDDFEIWTRFVLATRDRVAK